MATLDDVRAALRVVSTKTDSEIEDDIAASIADMRRVGVREELLDEDNLDPLVKFAIKAWNKASYGFDNSESEKWWKRYNITVSSLLNSKANECAETSDESTDEESGESTDEETDDETEGG